MLASKKIGILLLISHIFSSFTIGFLSRFYKYTSTNYEVNNYIPSYNTTSKNISEILKESIQNSITNVLTIGGFVLLASVCISILENIKFITLASNIISNIFNLNSNIVSNIFYGIIEVTNGVNSIANLSINYSLKLILISFLLGFGGFTVCLQVLGFTSKTDISIKPYIIGKFLQGIISGIYTYFLFKYVAYFSTDVEVFSGTIYDMIVNGNETTSLYFPFHWYLLVGILFFVGIFLLKSNSITGIRNKNYNSSTNLKNYTTIYDKNSSIKIHIR